MFSLAVIALTAAGQTPILVSGNAAGAAGDGASALNDFSTSFKTRKVSDDGRYVVFTSRAGDLSPTADANNFEDVFVRDLTTGTTIMVSVNSAGSDGGNNNSGGATISSDGRFVAFVSQATNLVAASDANGTDFDVFIRDLAAGTTKLVSVNVFGNATANGASLFPVINSDGRFVAFESFATDLSDTPDNPGSNDVFVRDTISGATVQVSVGTEGASADTNSAQPVMSADGRTIAFQTNANLTPNDTNGRQDIYVRSLKTGTTRLVSASAGGAESNGSGSFNPSISADGRFVAFTSSAANLVGNTTGNVNNVFVRDLLNNSTVLASVNAAGTNGGGAGNPVISADGRFVVFESAASNLTAISDGNNLSDVFARDLQTDTTTLISVNQSGASSGNRFSGEPNVSADGSIITFKSLATDLVNVADNNYAFDVFVRNTATKTTTLASVNTAQAATGNMQSGNYRPIYPAISANGQIVAFESLASDLANNDNNATYDVFAFRSAKPFNKRKRVRFAF